MALERMTMGLETEHQIYVGSAKDCKDSAQRQKLNHQATKALTEAAYSSLEIMGPRWTLARGENEVLRRSECQWLRNGARFYADIHGTPEYSTPECLTPDDLVTADLAGSRILAGLADEVIGKVGAKVMLYRNNSDGHGHSRGCHENYSISAVTYEHLVEGAAKGAAPRLWSTWLLVRQLLTGAGKVGVERDDRDVPFQLSQRPDFIRKFRTMDTIVMRPLIETRDEPHADGRLARRLHVIVGDTNCCPTATYLKTGLSGLLLMSLDDFWLYRKSLPVFTTGCIDYIRGISRDIDFRRTYPVTFIKGDGEGRLERMAVRDILRLYLDAIAEYAEQRSFPTDEETAAWRRVPGVASHCIEQLTPESWRELDGYLDWVTKRVTLERWLDRSGRSWKVLEARDTGWRRQARVRADLAYTSLDGGRGSFLSMLGDGRLKPLPGILAASARAISEPPTHGRARQRTALIERYGRWLTIIERYKRPWAGCDWSELTFRQGETFIRFEFMTPWGCPEEAFKAALEDSPTPALLADALSRRSVPNLAVATTARAKKEDGPHAA